MKKQSRLIEELIEYGQWYPYAEYYDLYEFGSKTASRKKKRMYIGDLVRRWKNKIEKQTGIRPEISQRKKPLPKDFVRVEQKNVFYSKKQEKNLLIVDQYSTFVATEEQMASYHNIDTTMYYAKIIDTNYWEQGAKIQVGKEWMIAKTPMHQLKIHWELCQDNIQEIKDMLMSNITLSPGHPRIKTNGSICVELMITDHHLGKLGFNPYTMEFNWTLKQAGQAYSDAIDYFISRFDQQDIHSFLLPTGNDLLNIDGSHNQTHKGTPQMAPVFWETIFRYGKNLLIATAEKLSKIAPVHIVMVRGNHDKDSVFSLGEVLEARFFDNPNIHVENELVRKRTYHSHGRCLIGYDHGDTLKSKDAHKIFDVDKPKGYATAVFKAVHKGHYHKKSRDRILEFKASEEINGIDIDTCPSLSPVDRWHSENLYVGNLRRTMCYAWHKNLGCIRQEYFNRVAIEELSQQ